MVARLKAKINIFKKIPKMLIWASLYSTNSAGPSTKIVRFWRFWLTVVPPTPNAMISVIEVMVMATPACARASPRRSCRSSLSLWNPRWSSRESQHWTTKLRKFEKIFNSSLSFSLCRKYIIYLWQTCHQYQFPIVKMATEKEHKKPLYLCIPFDM